MVHYFVAPQLEAALRIGRTDYGGLGGGVGGGDSSEDYSATSRSLMQQNVELRHKLEEEHSGYRRKLQAYQDGQTKQASLVQKLQAKVRTFLFFHISR